MTKILVLGGSGLIGSKFIELNKDSFEFEAPDLYELDILNTSQLESKISNFDGEVVLNFAAFTNVDGAEDEKGNKEGIVYKLNSKAPQDLALICKTNDKLLVHISTDYVFDGNKEDSPYSEDDLPNPVSWYGETKYYAEKFVQESGAKVCIVRFSMPFSAQFADKMDIGRTFLKLLKEGSEIQAINNQKVTPLLVDDAAVALRELIKAQKTGIWQVVCSDFTSPFDFAKTIAREFSLDENLVKPTSFEEYSQKVKAKRLKNSWLSIEKFESEFGPGKLHSVAEAVKIFHDQIDL